MKILYRQGSNGENRAGSLSLYGISNCYFKSIKQISKSGNVTRKRHSHTGYEFHIMVEGSQLYETENGRFLLDSGNILAIPKGSPHALVNATFPVEKFAFTFSLEEGAFDLGCSSECVVFRIPERVMSNIRAIEKLHDRFIAKNTLIENCVFETVLLLLKEMGIVEKDADLCVEDHVNNSGDERIELARQFISDNIESPIHVSEVAAYCYISEKQLNRLFFVDMGMTVSAYIRHQRIKRIEKLLSDTGIPLSQISDRLGFPNEHGFNVFFKKYNGMPPGEYRKMTKNGKS